MSIKTPSTSRCHTPSVVLPATTLVPTVVTGDVESDDDDDEAANQSDGDAKVRLYDFHSPY